MSFNDGFSVCAFPEFNKMSSDDFYKLQQMDLCENVICSSFKAAKENLMVWRNYDNAFFVMYKSNEEV